MMKLFKVRNTEIIGKDTLLLTIVPKRNRDAFNFQAGQYAAIGFKRNGRPTPMRCFSIVSSPRHPEAVQFAMRIHGDFTTAASELQMGDTVFLQGPFGEFLIDEGRHKNIIMLAGGIGITPFISMARYAVEKNSSVPMTLLYSCSRPDDIPFIDELIELEHERALFRVAYFITKGTHASLQNVRGATGRIDDQRLQQLTNGKYNNYTYFICGPKQFSNALRKSLLRYGTSEERIITEEFTPSSSTMSMGSAPRHNLSRWTYGLTGASLAVATSFFMVLDLVRAVPKTLEAQALSVPSQTQQQPQSSASTPTSTATSTPTPTSTATPSLSPSTDTSTSSSSGNSGQVANTYNNSPPPTSTNSSVTQSTTPSTNTSSGSSNYNTTSTPTQTYYQQPVTSVS